MDCQREMVVTAPAGVATTFPQMLVQLWRRFFRKSTLTATEKALAPLIARAAAGRLAEAAGLFPVGPLRGCVMHGNSSF